MRHFEFKAVLLFNNLFNEFSQGVPLESTFYFKVSRFQGFKLLLTVKMSSADKSSAEDVKVVGTRRPGEKFPDLDPVVPFVEIPPASDEAGVSKVSLRVRIDPAKGDERSNLSEIKMDMLESLHGKSAQFVHTRYLLDSLVFPKQGITGDKDCFKRLRIFESLLGPKTKSTFAGLLGRAIEEVFSDEGWSVTKPSLLKIKKDLSLFESVLSNGNDNRYKLTAAAGATVREKEAFLLEQYKKFEQYVYWFLGEMVFKDHRNCLDNHKDYVQNEIVKPKSMLVIDYLWLM